MSGSEKREFGDYQTPIAFCYKVCKYIQQQGFAAETKAILEPTCGVGNFLSAASSIFGYSNTFGIEINEKYAQLSREAVPTAKVITDNIFDVNTKQICGTSDVLIIGNPPWATNANLFYNLPQKKKILKGCEALMPLQVLPISTFVNISFYNCLMNIKTRTVLFVCYAKRQLPEMLYLK